VSKKLFALLVLGSMIAFLLVACGTTSTDTSSAPNQVHMNATNFVSSSITIKKGGSITLIDDTLVPHHCERDVGKWDSEAGERARRTGGQGRADQWLQSSLDRPLHHCWDLPSLLYHSLRHELDRHRPVVPFFAAEILSWRIKSC
jgi:hypothetical protein